MGAMCTDAVEGYGGMMRESAKNTSAHCKNAHAVMMHHGVHKPDKSVVELAIGKSGICRQAFTIANASHGCACGGCLANEKGLLVTTRNNK